MKLSTYAKQLGISYQTAWKLFKDGKLNAYKLPTGTVIVREEETMGAEQGVAVYCRVSSSENKGNLESEKRRLLDYCAAKGYKVNRVVTEVGSGINDARKQWLSLLQDRTVRIIVVEHKDRLTRFGFAGYKALLNTDGRDIEGVNESDNDKEGLLQDLVSIIKQTCQYQVVGTLDSFISNRQNDFVYHIHRSAFNEDAKHRMFAVNKYELWYNKYPFL
jgi:predicted site-specific integrase-resolvase